MQVIILAAGQGTRLRPLTDDRPKCMVEIHGESIIRRQLATMRHCGIAEKDIAIVGGYREDALREHLADTKVQFVSNDRFMETNMVYSLMCAQELFCDDVIVSYGDIIYKDQILGQVLASEHDISVVVDDGWQAYWEARGEGPLDDAETLKFSSLGTITEIGQKPAHIGEIESQYIGLMRFRGKGVQEVLSLCDDARQRSQAGKTLWRTSRNYDKMYMTDLLQGLADEGSFLNPVRINRGWFEVDSPGDLALADRLLDW